MPEEPSLSQLRPPQNRHLCTRYSTGRQLCRADLFEALVCRTLLPKLSRVCTLDLGVGRLTRRSIAALYLPFSCDTVGSQVIMPRYYRDDVRERSRDRRRPRSRDRSRERSRDRSRERFRRSPTHDHDDGDEGEVESGVFAWIPAAGIDFDVITEDLPLYMGADSKVERGKNPKVQHYALWLEQMLTWSRMVVPQCTTSEAPTLSPWCVTFTHYGRKAFFRLTSPAHVVGPQKRYNRLGGRKGENGQQRRATPLNEPVSSR